MATQESEDELAGGQVCVLTPKECTPCSWSSQRAFQQPDVFPFQPGCQGHLLQSLIPKAGSKTFFFFSVVCQLALPNVFVS